MQNKSTRTASLANSTLGSLKEINLINRALRASFASLGVFILGFCLAPTLASEASAASTVSTAVSWDPISLTLDPHGDIDFGEVIPSSRDTTVGNYGTQKVVKKAIDITTNGDYYAVYLSTIGNDNSLSTSADTIQAIPAIGSAFDPESASSGASFSQTSWGFAIPTISTSATLSAYDSFLASSSDTTANNLSKLGTGSTVYNTGAWSAVPALADVKQIYSNSTNVVTGFSSGDSFNIYYSIMVDTNTLSGAYENEVVYTAIATASAGDVSYNVTRDQEILTAGSNETETLQLDLATVPESLTASDIVVRLVPHSIFASNNYSVANLTLTDYPDCSVSSVTSSGQSATIICSVPKFGAKGSTDTAGTYAIADSNTYDFWVQVTLPDSSTVDYISHYQDGTNDVATVTYKTGLQSINTSNNKLITTMQGMSGSICENTLAYDSDNSATTTFSLTDVRDSIDYNVRKLGNNCWMVSNLRFVGTSLDVTTSDTDVSKSFTYTDQTQSTSSVEPRIHSGTDNNGDPTVWYNYAAASALTITGSNNINEAQYSICPKNWTLPNYVQAKKIVDEYNGGFIPVWGGNYPDTNFHLPLYGFWWTSTARNDWNRHALSLKSDSMTWSFNQYYGYLNRAMAEYIRCVARDQ